MSKIFNGLVISTTSLSESEKSELNRTITANGGKFVNDITNSTTHLLALNAGSEKFIQAVKLKIPIIHPNWIEQSLKAKTLLPYDKFKLPVFMGCIISAEGLSEEEISKINRIVTDEGGEFSTIYTRGFTTHYITTPELMAKRNKESNNDISIECLSSKWVYDSLEKQYPLPTHSYILTKQEENEKIKLSQSINNNNNAINSSESNLSSFDHCILSSYGSTSFNQNVEMLCRKVGIIYYPDISPIINYLILEDSLIDYPPQKDIIDKNSITCLKLSWLMECIEQKHFIFPNKSHFWISKKAKINLSKSNSVSFKSISNSSSNSSSFSVKSNLFQGKRISLIFFEKNDILKNNIKTIIESNSGTIVNSMQISNYIICGKAIDMEQPTTIPLLTDIRTVTYKWLEKCLKENKIINRKDDSLYYPHPNIFRDLKMSISQYTGTQREYIKDIISALGGRCEETFNSSHNYLICFQPNGEKYKKANEWKIPCVTGQWVCQCAVKDEILSIDSFIVKPKNVNDVLKRNNEIVEKSTPNRKKRKTKK